MGIVERVQGWVNRGEIAASSAVREKDPAWTTPRATPLGSSGTTIRGGRLQYEEFNSKLENEKGWGDYGTQGVYDLMRKTDPHIRRALQLLKLPLRSAQWVFEPASDSDLDKEIAEFCSYALFERLCWDDVLRQSLLMYDFGFVLFEILEDTYEVPRSRFKNLPSSGTGSDTANAVLWSAIDPRLPKTVDQWVPRADRPTMLAAIVQQVGGSDVEEGTFRTIPADRLLRFTHDQEGGNFAGASVLRSAYKPWKILETLERIDVLRHERQNCGTPVISLPETGVQEGDADKAEKILMTVGRSERGYIVEPPGWKFRWETSGEGTGTNVEAAIERCIRAIADNVLAGFMALGGGDTGSYALAETQADHYLASIEAGARYVEEVWNKGSDGVSHVRRLVDLNYGPQRAYPRLRATNLKSRDYGQILPLVAQLLAAKALTPSRDLENYLRNRLDLPPSNDDEHDEVRTREQEDDEAEKQDKAPAPPVNEETADAE